MKSQISEIPDIDLLSKWQFPWPIMKVLIGGQSSIDLQELRVDSWDEATEFINSYGYDPDNPDDARLIHAVHIESLNFIERHLVNFDASDSERPPDEVLYCNDIRHLLIYASSTASDQVKLRAWSCALLRIMHTVAHIEGVQRWVNMEDAREQIEGRFRKYLFRNDAGELCMGDSDQSVVLDKVDFKGLKKRESVILKLLHKKGNVAETIYDLVGVRIVTKRLCDVMVVVKFLRKFHMVTFANINPGRVRNSLMDVERFRGNLQMLLEMLSDGRIDNDEFERLLEKTTTPSSRILPTSVNPHSANSYRAIQLTCRQLVRTASVANDWLKDLKEHFGVAATEDPALGSKLLELLESWPGLKKEKDLSVFVPFEVQVLDENSYSISQSGAASHDRYKSSQIRAARRRVLSDVMKLKRKK